MAVSNYRQWRADGQPWRSADYIRTFAATMRQHSYTVGTIGAVKTHLDIEYPQDHSPFSHTPWPDPQPYPVVCACDIMDDGPVDLATLGAQIVADKNAGVAGTEWIKYINWTDKHGTCWCDSWKPNHRRSRSGDRGHIHISGRTDKIHQETSYDPIGRILHPNPAPVTPPPMPGPAPKHERPGTRRLFLSDPKMLGDDVAFLQRWIGPEKCGRDDGVFGKHSEDGVRWYQDDQGLTVDGVVGPKTWARIGVV